jgi:hypothetical protein
MTTRIALLLFPLAALSACGPMPDADALPAVDEAACHKETLEADGVDSNELTTLPPGSYVITTTYLRLKHSKATLARFQALTNPMTEELAANPGLVRVTTRLSSACNTARTLSVWKSELEMYRFVTGPSHAKAMAAVTDLSRGGSVTTHWSGDATGATWQRAVEMLAADTDGPTY